MKTSVLCLLFPGLLSFVYGAPRGSAPRHDLGNTAEALDKRASGALPGQANYTAVPNGQPWYDNDGNVIDSHGGGFLKVDDWYYWVGETESASVGPPYDEAHVKLYKSKDLLNWDYTGPIITVYTPDENGIKIFTYCNVERPKLVYNAKTKKYVVWAHWEEHVSYSPSRLFVATADEVEGPYTVTAKGSFRPGEGNQDESAMGERVGAPIPQYGVTPRTAGNTSQIYAPVSGSDYPPRALQYKGFSSQTPNDVVYVSQDDYGSAQRDNSWTYEFTGVNFNLTVKLVSVKMTPWNTTYYNKYSPYWNIDAANYVFRYPTEDRSEVTTFAFVIGDPGNERTALVKPDIRPGLDESSSDETVLVHSGDAAFITCNTTDSIVYYTTDGSTPTVTANSRYWTGTRISVQGDAGKNLTVKAICSLNNETSSVVSQQYTIVSNDTEVPIFRPFLSIPPGTYQAEDAAFGYKSVRIYCPSYGNECYYTMDGKDPEPPVLGHNIGYRARDETIWVDPKDDSAYLFVASDNSYNRVWQLNDDYTDVLPDKEYDVFSLVSREAPALVRNGGKSGEYVYLITSTQSGWYPNQAEFVRTTDVTAGFDLPRDPISGYRNGNTTWSSLTPVGNPTTFYSQPTYILDISTNGAGPYIYVGDRWNPDELWQSTNVFLPLVINDTGISVTGEQGTGFINLTYVPNLAVDVAKGTIPEPEWRLLSLNKPVNASRTATLTAEQIAAGTYDYKPERANDGIDFDQGPYDDIEQFYKPASVPFYWQVDLEKEYNISWIGLSFMSVGGSDSVNRYTVSGSKDNSYFYPLVDNTGNLHPGYTAHILSGSFRYIKINDYSIYDVIHNKEADWEAAVYEISVYGTDPDP